MAHEQPQSKRRLTRRDVVGLLGKASLLAPIVRASAFVPAIAPAIAPALLSAQSKPLPPKVEAYLKDVIKLTASERATLVGGGAVTKLLDADPSSEVAVFGATWVNASPADYVKAVTDIERFERGTNFRVTKKISEPARLDDFAQLVLPADDVKDLQRCEAGKCNLKLSQQSIDRVRKAIDWSKPTAKADVDRMAQQLAFEYVNAYREGGNERLAVYRDAARPTFVATEFASLVQRMPELTTYLPNLRRYLLEYPKFALPGTMTSFLYWQEAAFGLKPTVRINHVVIAQNSDGVAVASKQLYASHYFWTALELRVLVQDPSRPNGFWFLNVNRSRSDGLSGFVGRIIRGKVRGEARNGMEAALRITKANLEKHA